MLSFEKADIAGKMVVEAISAYGLRHRAPCWDWGGGDEPLPVLRVMKVLVGPDSVTLWLDELRASSYDALVPEGTIVVDDSEVVERHVVTLPRDPEEDVTTVGWWDRAAFDAFGLEAELGRVGDIVLADEPRNIVVVDS